MNLLYDDKKIEAIRREAFVQGYIAAADPKTAAGTLLLLPKADEAYALWRRTVTQTD